MVGGTKADVVKKPGKAEDKQGGKNVSLIGNLESSSKSNDGGAGTDREDRDAQGQRRGCGSARGDRDQQHEQFYERLRPPSQPTTFSPCW